MEKAFEFCTLCMGVLRAACKGVNSRMESTYYRDVERVKGIEPSYEAWEAAVLPLNYTRVENNRCETIFLPSKHSLGGTIQHRNSTGLSSRSLRAETANCCYFRRSFR